MMVQEATQIEQVLLSGIRHGEIRRLRLANGIGLAYSEGGSSGLLTLSRPFPHQPPDEKEIRRIRQDFQKAALRLQRPVLLFKELSRETVHNSHRKHHVVRFAVYFGKQGRLF